MSEYQRYEFMTIDRPLTRAQLDAVNGLSSHIEASSTHALIEYHWVTSSTTLSKYSVSSSMAFSIGPTGDHLN